MDPKETFYGSPIRKSLSTRYVLSSDFGLATVKERKKEFICWRSRMKYFSAFQVLIGIFKKFHGCLNIL